MSRFLRTTPTRRLLAILAAFAAAVAGTAAIAIAASGGGPTPPPAELPVAVHDALSHPAPAGITARISFTNDLVDSSSLPGAGGDPLLSGATGRLWLSAGRLRLDFQSEKGDAQILADKTGFTLYDAASNTVYKGTFPAPGTDHADTHAVPTLARITQALTHLQQHADVSGAQPGDVANQPAYSVRLSPKHDGGLLGAAELAWDANTGTPLRAAIYASGSSSPALELEATDISYGSVDDSVFAVSPPAGAHVVDLAPKMDDGAPGTKPAVVTGQDAVQQAVGFTLSAPDTLVGLQRHAVRLIGSDGDHGALVTYGKGLGGIAVLETPAKPATTGERRGAVALPKVSINGISGEGFDTALGTVVRFERGGVAYTVLGSVPPAAAEAAVRAL